MDASEGTPRYTAFSASSRASLPRRAAKPVILIQYVVFNLVNSALEFDSHKCIPLLFTLLFPFDHERWTPGWAFHISLLSMLILIGVSPSCRNSRNSLLASAWTWMERRTRRRTKTFYAKDDNRLVHHPEPGLIIHRHDMGSNETMFQCIESMMHLF